MNNINNIIASPWGDYPVDLTGIKLTIEQKTWLGEFMITTQNSEYILRNRYKLKRTQLWHYRKCVQDNIKIYKGRGRPRVIDEMGIEEITNYVRSESPSKELFKQVLMQEHVNTVCRRKPGIDADGVKPLSKRSVNRYTSNLFHYDDDDPDLDLNNNIVMV